MKNSINFTPARDTLKTILGNGKHYTIPKFQRDYSWTKENWEDLWLDIMDIWNDQDQHYMGNMVFRSTNNSTEEFEVIDGQQRLITLSLIIHAIVQFLIDNNQNGLAENIKKEYLFRRLVGKENYNVVKLQLNDSNHNLYVRLSLDKSIINKRSENTSNKLIFDAYNYFYDQIKKEFEYQETTKIDEFLNYFASNLIFIHITSDTDEKAYSIFETLNSRGLGLSSVDLIKNYILGIVADEGTKSLWDNFATVLDKDLFGFIRHYMMIKSVDGKVIREKNTFKTFKKNHKGGDQILNFLKDANKYASFYSALGNSNSDFWLDYNKKNHIEELVMFKATQYKVLALSIFINNPDLLLDTLKIIKNLTFRYSTICGNNPNDLETAYSSLAKKIANNDFDNKNLTIKIIKNELSSVMVSDELFKSAFVEKEINYKDARGKKIISYILWRIESQKSQNSNEDAQDSSATIEHILPENPDDSWNFEGNLNDYKNKLGNLALLEPSKNRDIANQNFEKKKEIYVTSQYATTQDLANNQEWQIKNLKQRQEKMAKLACVVWAN